MNPYITKTSSNHSSKQIIQPIKQLTMISKTISLKSNTGSTIINYIVIQIHVKN